MSLPSQQAVFRLSPRVHVVPIRHGSADVSMAIRDLWLTRRFDCVGLPLPASVEHPVEEGIRRLPVIGVVVLPEPGEPPGHSYVPLDPCQPVIAAIRMAMEEGIDRAYLDREVTTYEPTEYPAPDPYALRCVSLASFLGATLPFLPYPRPQSQRWSRIKWMAFKLHELELDFRSILCLCSVEDWPWLRDAYRNRWPYEGPESLAGPPTLHLVEPRTLYFLLCELPFLTELFERRRVEARSDAHLSVDGIKELLLETRRRWLATRPAHLQQETNWVTPQLLQMYLQYVRNLALGRMPPHTGFVYLDPGSQTICRRRVRRGLARNGQALSLRAGRITACGHAPVFGWSWSVRVSGRSCLDGEESTGQYARLVENVVAQAQTGPAHTTSMGLSLEPVGSMFLAAGRQSDRRLHGSRS